MKKTKKVLLIIIAVITFTIYKNVFAIDACTNSEMERLRELANNVEFKTNYDFDIVDKDMKKIYLNYTIEFINLDDDLKISYKVNNGETIELEPGVKSIKNLGPDNKITISIYSYTDNLCTERLLRTKTINLLPYNDYYYFNKEKCQEYPEFEYCQEFIRLKYAY